MCKTAAFLLFTFVLIIGCSGLGEKTDMPAEEAQAPVSSPEVMSDMAMSVQTIAMGIFAGNFEAVRNGALDIAKNKTHLYENLGDVEREFAEKIKKYDDESRLAALDLAEAAGLENIDEVLVQFERMNEGCIGCHKVFRD